MRLGEFVTQPQGYKAFIPSKFPPKEAISMSPQIQLLTSDATLVAGKLDGISQLVPDIDFFTYMYVRKEAALSSNIEGTQATMHDALRADIKITEGVPSDVENILHYIEAINYGLSRLDQLPLSSRLIREIHDKLMRGTAEGIGKTPGQFRTTQNWIGGTRPDNADFVPPPPHELNRVLNDFEHFLNDNSEYPPLVKVALMHAQFETIHPFLDGNGRTGRLLISLFLCQQKVLEHPVLYLSEYFKRHREAYFSALSAYHNRSDTTAWLTFFLEGAKQVAEEAIVVSKKITTLREKDMEKIHSLSGKQAPTAIKLLLGLYRQPIVDVATVQEITGLSRPAANHIILKFISIGLLDQSDPTVTYGRQFVYTEYLNLFESK
jgi:Fic family protein